MSNQDKTLKEIGYLSGISLLATLDALDMTFAALEMTGDERIVLGAVVRQGIQDHRIHRYFNYYTWFAQKPEA